MNRAVASWSILILMILLTGCGSNDGGRGVAQITTGNLHDPVGIELIDGTGVVPTVTVNGTLSLGMLVDTGAARTYVPAGIFGNPGGEVHIDSLCFDNQVCFKGFAAKSSDSAFTQSKKGYFNGIIGMDLLGHFDLTIDYKGERIYFFDLIDEETSKTIAIPIHFQTGRPYAPAAIEGVDQGLILLDTGAAFARMTPSVLATLDQSPNVLFTSFTFAYDAKEIVQYIPLNGYCVGTACLDETITQIGSWPATGGTFFREFLTVFKFSENILKLNRYADRDHICESGLERTGIQINIFDASQVIYVIPESPAFQGGLEEGSVLLSVNDIPVETLGYFGIHDLFSDTSVKAFEIVNATPSGELETLFVNAE